MRRISEGEKAAARAEAGVEPSGTAPLERPAASKAAPLRALEPE